MKHNKILSAILALTVTASLVGCSGDSGIVPNSSGTTSQNTSGATNASGSGALTPNDPATSGNTSSDTSASSGSSDVSNSSGDNSDTSSPSSGNDGSNFVMPSIDELLLNLPVEFKGPDKEPAAGTPGAETPRALDFVRAVGANIENAGSFVLTGEIKGDVTNVDPHSAGMVPIEEKYVFVVDKNTSYLRVAHKQKVGKSGTEDHNVIHEEYNILNDDGTITIIVKNGDKWIGAKSADKLNAFLTSEDLEARIKREKSDRTLRINLNANYNYAGSDLYSNAIATFGPITLFNSQFPEKTLTGEKATIVGNVFGDPVPTVERDNNGNLTFSFKPAGFYETTLGGYDGVNFMQYPNSDMQRYFPVSANNYKSAWSSGSINYKSATKPLFTVSNDDVLMKAEGNVGGTVDVDYVFNFSNWGNVAKINVPEYTLDPDNVKCISKWMQNDETKFYR